MTLQLELERVRVEKEEEEEGCIVVEVGRRGAGSARQ
jgi:hypothetical protein